MHAEDDSHSLPFSVIHGLGDRLGLEQHARNKPRHYGLSYENGHLRSWKSNPAAKQARLLPAKRPLPPA